MKQIKQDFSFEGWARAKNQPFQNMVILHIKLKGMKHTKTW